MPAANPVSMVMQPQESTLQQILKPEIQKDSQMQGYPQNIQGGSRTKLLERGWALFYSEVAREERQQACLRIAPQLCRQVVYAGDSIVLLRDFNAHAGCDSDHTSQPPR